MGLAVFARLRIQQLGRTHRCSIVAVQTMASGAVIKVVEERMERSLDENCFFDVV